MTIGLGGVMSCDNEGVVSSGVITVGIGSIARMVVNSLNFDHRLTTVVGWVVK